jgi:hypothetical protein
MRRRFEATGVLNTDARVVYVDPDLRSLASAAHQNAPSRFGIFDSVGYMSAVASLADVSAAGHRLPESHAGIAAGRGHHAYERCLKFMRCGGFQLLIPNGRRFNRSHVLALNNGCL